MKIIKEIRTFFGFLGIVFGFLAFLFVLLLCTPYIYYKNVQFSRKIKKILKNDLKKYNGKIVFLYGAYHTYDFTWYFKKFHPEISCIQVPNHGRIDVFTGYLTSRNPPKSLPQLVKIVDGHLFKKVHYSSFKYYITKKNGAANFCELIERSIDNLQEIE